MSRLEADTIAKRTADPARDISTERLIRGVPKLWASLNGTGVIALGDSINVSSAIDNGVGEYLFNTINSFSNVLGPAPMASSWITSVTSQSQVCAMNSATQVIGRFLSGGSYADISLYTLSVAGNVV